MPESQVQTLPAKLPFGQITPETLERLKKTAPDAFADPSELADALFSNGNLEAAGYFYQVNLKRTLTPEDKAWTLFQIGNCLVDIDATKAEELYKKLLADFPDSPWVLLAEGKVELIEWYRLNKPQTVLESLDDILKPSANTRPTDLTQTESP